MAELFDVNVPAISKHLQNVFIEGELDETSVISKMEIIASDDKNYLVKMYNFDAIIAVGYRINYIKATEFRQWTAKTLKEYITKGFALNDDTLKNGRLFGKDFFRELLFSKRDQR